MIFIGGFKMDFNEALSMIAFVGGFLLLIMGGISAITLALASDKRRNNGEESKPTRIAGLMCFVCGLIGCSICFYLSSIFI